MSRKLVLALLLAGCAAPPAKPPPQIVEEPPATELLSELLMGSHGPYPDAKLEAYVASVGQRVTARGARLRFRVSDDPTPMAHSLPGNVVLVSRGALALLDSEAELAALLAHETAHAEMGHTDLRKTALPSDESSSEIDEDEERQADALAVKRVARAGYDPHAVGRALAALHRGVVHACQTERARDDCATAHDADDPHPALRARLARVAIAAGAGSGNVGRERFLAAIDGLSLGGSDAVLESGRFQLPGGLSFAVPREMTAEQSSHVMSAKGPGTALVIVRLHGRMFREALAKSVRSSTFVSRQVAGHPTLIGSLDGDQEYRLAVIDAAPFVHLVAVAGVAREELLERVLSSARPAPKRPNLRLCIVTAARAAPLETLCQGGDPALLRALNGRTDFARGERAKCISQR